MATHETRERSARRACARRGLMLRRNRRRDPDAYDYGRYQILEASTGLPIAAGPFRDLAAVERWLVATSKRPVIAEAAA